MISRKQSRDADLRASQHFLIPSLVLMENAGRGCAEKLIWHSPQGKLKGQAVVVLCGPGNNGGDGFVMARHLYNARIPTKVILFRRPEDYKNDALRNLKALSQLRMPVVEFCPSWSESKICEVFQRVKRSKTTWIVDALLGTGAQGEPRTSIAQAIKLANRQEVRRMALDLPTGLDCDSGEPSNTTFKADITCTFIAPKMGFENPNSILYTGVVTTVDIGAPQEILNQHDSPQ